MTMSLDRGDYWALFFLAFALFSAWCFYQCLRLGATLPAGLLFLDWLFCAAMLVLLSRLERALGTPGGAA